LRNQLQSIGSDLIIRVGIPEIEIFKLAQESNSSWVYCNRERTSEEVQVQDHLEQKLWSIGQELRYERGKMLFYTADLPFPIGQVPDVFSQYRKEVENIITIRKPLPIPKLNPFPDIDIDRGEMPTLDTFKKGKINLQHEECQKLIGGEIEGIRQMKSHFNEEVSQNAKDELIDWDFTSKLSAWLSTGCLSPKLVYEEMKKSESDHSKNDNNSRIFHDLLKRDFLRLMGKKYGNRIFQINGINKRNEIGKNDELAFEKWANGKTGVPFIDANMIQLNETGFMTYRGRINTSGYLVYELGVNWQMGAEYFESLLIDYDPCSNYGNWNHVAGIGSDLKEEKRYNIISQAKKYDPHGHFINRWLSLSDN
jgi:deoxyribodipyrimidine photo-lyase